MSDGRGAIERNWRARGLEARTLLIGARQVVDDEIADEDRLIVLIEGEVEFELDGQVLMPAVGQELEVPAGALHSLRGCGRLPARLLSARSQTRN